MGLGYSFKDGDWPRLRQIIQKLSSLKFGPDATPTFAGLTLNGDLDLSDNDLLNPGNGHDDFDDFVATEHLDHALNLDADLIAWLRMDDIDGSGNPVDLGSEGMSWVANNQAAQTDAGVIGKAFTFDGAGDSVNVTTPTGMPTGTAARTITIWFRTTDTNDQTVFAYGEAGNGKNMTFVIKAAGFFQVSVQGGRRNGTTTTLQDGKWHLVGITYDPTDGNDIEDADIYVDGVKEVGASLSEVLQTTQANLYIGTSFDGATNPFDGELDDFRVYGRKLDDNEMLELYELGTLDTMTTFGAAYFKEYLASRHGYFNNLAVTGTANDLTMTGLTVTGGRDIDINASDLVGVGDFIPETDGGSDIGSTAKTIKDIHISNSIVLDDAASIGLFGAMELIFDISNNYLKFISGEVVLQKASGKGIRVDTTTPTFGWRDLQGDVLIKVVGANDPDYNDYAGTGIYRHQFKNNAMTQIFNDYHIPHDYVPGSDVFMHIHWSQTTIDTGGAAGAPGNAKWYFDANYSKGHDRGAFPAGVVTVSPAAQTASGTIRQHLIAEVQMSTSGQIGGQDLEPDGIVTVRSYRDAADPADTLDQRPWVHHADIHYQSTNIATKQKAPDFYT